MNFHFARRVFVLPRDLLRPRFSVHRECAERMVQLGQVEPIGCGGRIRAVVMTGDPGVPTGSATGRALVGTKFTYSENVAGNRLTFHRYIRKRDEPLFRQAQLECMGILVR